MAYATVPGKGRIITLAAAATSVTFSGLNGDADVIYEFGAAILFNSAGALITLLPNNLATNQRSASSQVTNIAGFAGTVTNNLLLPGTTNAAQTTTFTGMFMAKRGSGARGHQARGFIPSGAGAGLLVHNAGVWQEDTTLVTSLVFLSDQASGLGAGSYFWLRPIGGE